MTGLKWSLVVASAVWFLLVGSASGTGLTCYVCAHNTKAGNEANCGRGTPHPCDTLADVMAAKKISTQPLPDVGNKNSTTTCFKRMKDVPGGRITTRGCINEAGEAALKKDCKAKDWTCAFCKNSLDNGQACNGGARVTAWSDRGLGLALLAGLRLGLLGMGTMAMALTAG